MELKHATNIIDETKRVKALSAEGHFELVETLADNIASMCLADQRVIEPA